MALQDAPETEDQRDVELSTLTAIFPEIQIQDDDPFSILLEVPVNPSREVAVSFPAPSTQALPTAGASSDGAEARIESHRLSHLPSLRLLLSLPPSYPSENPPTASICTYPPWLPSDVTKRLEGDAERLWQEFGHDLVAYSFIDHLQQSADDVFGMLSATGVLELDSEFKLALLDYDIRAKRAAFERGTFDCGVCLEPKKGSVCHCMLDCGHVFCKACLQDFYNTAIKQGDLATVRCLEPSCAKDREKAASALAPRKRAKAKTFISPGELLQIPLEREAVQRYVDLKYKTELESDKNTIYCPRSWCEGAARSKKHRKPEGLELVDAGEDADEDDDTSELGDNADATAGAESTSGKARDYRAKAEDLLAICEDCGFAFCSRCMGSWHGEFYWCMPARDRDQLSAEEKASLEYMALHTTPCPTCRVPAQKTMGCNHMTCFRCQTHFCYLCSAWLDPGNPYRHFNELPGGRRTACYNRLWELEAGDGDNVGYNFAGGVLPHDPEPEREQEDQEDQDVAAPDAEQPARAANGVNRRLVAVVAAEPGEGEQERHPRVMAGRVEVAREGPLVLRVDAEVPAAQRGRGAGGPRRRGGRDANGPLAPQQQQQAARGGRRGRGRGRAGAAAAGRGQAIGNGGNRQARGAAVRAQGVNGGARGHAGVGGGDVQLGDGMEDLDAVQQAWIRQFVQLALDDEEDLLDWGFDEEDEDEDRVANFVDPA